MTSSQTCRRIRPEARRLQSLPSRPRSPEIRRSRRSPRQRAKDLQHPDSLRKRPRKRRRRPSHPRSTNRLRAPSNTNHSGSPEMTRRNDSPPPPPTRTEARFQSLRANQSTNPLAENATQFKYAAVLIHSDQPVLLTHPKPNDRQIQLRHIITITGRRVKRLHGLDRVG